MKKIIEELDSIVTEFSIKLMRHSENDLAAKLKPGKWSKKEIVGHLIDSGQNNLRRFICGQYESVPPKIVYDQDFWVASNQYHQYKKEDIIQLWKLTNAQISYVLTSMPEKNHTKTTRTDQSSEDEKTLHWLAADYVKHMKHHLNQIFENSFDIIYPYA